MKLSLAHGSEPRAPGRTPTAARRARRRGVAAVELAILAPFLGVLVMGMFEMGRLVMVKDILTDSVRKGGRTGATPGKTYQNVLDDANGVLTDNGITSTNATITVQVATYTGTSTTPSWGSFTTVSNSSSFNPGALDQVSVQVSIPASDVLWIPSQFLTTGSIQSETLIMLRQG